MPFKVGSRGKQGAAPSGGPGIPGTIHFGVKIIFRTVRDWLKRRLDRIWGGIKEEAGAFKEAYSAPSDQIGGVLAIGFAIWIGMRTGLFKALYNLALPLYISMSGTIGVRQPAKPLSQQVPITQDTVHVVIYPPDKNGNVKIKFLPEGTGPSLIITQEESKKLGLEELTKKCSQKRLPCIVGLAPKESQ